MADSRSGPRFLIVGAGRSGTTLLRLLLVSRYEVEIPPETAYLTDLLIQARAVGETLATGPAGVRALQAALEQSAFVATMRIDWHELCENATALTTAVDFCRSVYEGYCRRIPGDYLIGDKTPSNLRYLPLLAEAYEHPKVVAMVRDPRAVVASTLALGWVPDVRVAIGKWLDSSTHIKQAEEECRDFLAVRYEDLVQDTEQVLATVAQHVAAPARCGPSGRLDLAFPDHHPNLFRPVCNRNSVAGLSTSQLREIDAALHDKMLRFGYSPTAEADRDLEFACASAWKEFIHPRRPAVRL